MKTPIWAVTMVKDEIDVIAPALEWMSKQGVDGMIVADNGSTDGTYEYLLQRERSAFCEGGPKLYVFTDSEAAYYQSRKMTSLAFLAAQFSALSTQCDSPWIIPFDADELFMPGPQWRKTIAEQIHLFDDCPEVDVLNVSVANHFPTYLDDPAEANPFRRLRYRHKPPNALPKVIARWRPGLIIAQGNHGAAYDGVNRAGLDASITIRHYPYRSKEQFVRKAINGAAAYKAALDLPEGMGAHWRMYGRMIEEGGEAAAIAHFEKWFYFRDDRMGEMTLDPVIGL